MKTKITLLIFYLIFQYNGQSQVEVIEHCVTQSSLLPSGTVSVIDDSVLNGNPNMTVVLQKIRLEENGDEVNNPGNISLDYDSVLGRWVILDEDGSQLVSGACYNLAIVGPGEDFAFDVKCDAGSIDPTFTNTCIIDNPEINDDFSARCMYSSVRDSDNIINDLDYDLYYNYASPGSWILWTLIGQLFPVNARFNLICNPVGMTYFEHISDFGNTDRVIVSAQIFSLWTVLTHPLLDNNPGAKIFVSHRREPSTDFFVDSNSVKYNASTGNWQIHWELETLTSGDLTFPTNRFWDIFILDDTLSANDRNTSLTKAYPNPTDSVFHIECQKQISEVILYNNLGQALETINGKDRQHLAIDISKYSEGTYFAKVIIKDQIETIQLVKN
ncbi:T9SS type A sorting domain-containing protein [Winogradskyella sp.]|uniref:T9SS type A sorting domain-containing protein n=1 Tax=Winogradskyella sp. TaxID=1883156 RepID=UPI003BAD8F21